MNFSHWSPFQNNGCSQVISETVHNLMAPWRSEKAHWKRVWARTGCYHTLTGDCGKKVRKQSQPTRYCGSEGGHRNAQKIGKSLIAALSAARTPLFCDLYTSLSTEFGETFSCKSEHRKTRGFQFFLPGLFRPRNSCARALDCFIQTSCTSLESTIALRGFERYGVYHLDYKAAGSTLESFIMRRTP